MAAQEELIGRSDINDVEASLAITNSDVDEVAHGVKDNADAIFTWDYDRSRPALGKLYEKAKTSQWNAELDLDWSTPVDQEKLATEMGIANAPAYEEVPEALRGTPMEKWGDKEWIEMGIQQQN